MNDELFAKIIDECAAEGCSEVHLHNFGEPLLDKQLEERVRYAKRKGLPKVKIFSNGSLLTEARARRLVEARLDEIKISIDGATKEEFDRIRVPLRFDQVIANVERLVAVRNELMSNMKVYVTCCTTTDKQATMQSLEKTVDGFSFARIHNWAGAAGANGHRQIRKPCLRLWKTLTILSSGDVALCCLDYEGKYLLGRIDESTTISEVWQGAAYQRVRLLHKRARQHEISLCSDCTKSFL